LLRLTLDLKTAEINIDASLLYLLRLTLDLKTAEVNINTTLRSELDDLCKKLAGGMLMTKVSTHTGST